MGNHAPGFVTDSFRSIDPEEKFQLLWVYKIIFIIASSIVNGFAIPFMIRSFKNNGTSWSSAAVFVLNLTLSMIFEMYFSHQRPEMKKVFGCLLCFIGVVFINIEKNINDQ